jgi:hypothetical protein
VIALPAAQVTPPRREHVLEEPATALVVDVIQKQDPVMPVMTIPTTVTLASLIRSGHMGMIRTHIREKGQGQECGQFGWIGASPTVEPHQGIQRLGALGFGDIGMPLRGPSPRPPSHGLDQWR